MFFGNSNSFFGAAPQHPVIANTIKKILKHVQTSDYSHDPWYVTGPNLFLEEFKKYFGDEYEKHFAGRYFAVGKKQLYFSHKGNKRMVLHKCMNCGQNQDWGATGNNYIDLYKNRQFYCEDAASLFHTTSSEVGNDVHHPHKHTSE